MAQSRIWLLTLRLVVIIVMKPWLIFTTQLIGIQTEHPMFDGIEGDIAESERAG